MVNTALGEPVTKLKNWPPITLTGGMYANSQPAAAAPRAITKPLKNHNQILFVARI